MCEPRNMLYHEICYNTHMRRGQTMVEYVVTLSALLVVAALLWSLSGVAVRYSARTDHLVAGEYP